jgi:broad specificity phosphatase PhoE
MEPPPPDVEGPRPGLGGGARVWLARHAQVHAGWSAKSYGPEDVPLSAEGELRTVDFGASLAATGPQQVVSSELSRARLLGERVARHRGLVLRTDRRLAEVDRGRWRGRVVADLHREDAAEVQRFYLDPWTYRGHGGESDSDVAERAWPALLEVLAAAEGGVAVLAGHYNVIRVLCARALGLAPARSFALRLDTGRASLLLDGPGGFRLLGHNVFDPGRHEVGDEHLGLSLLGDARP